MKKKEATDYLIECGNPEAFDRTIQMIGAAALVQDAGNGYVKKEGYYVMRVFSNNDYIKFAINSQGYGKIIKELDELI